ncbi:MAG TPA: hypothetical protein VN453_00970 [Feifaniaceae bacterium]|nr:hypothetical protein [Feifaniaceae bacterium]
MSRAFVSENDGYAFCTKSMSECVWADEKGDCVFSRCRREGEQAPATSAGTQAAIEPDSSAKSGKTGGDKR